MSINVAIDGPAGAGKSTISRRAAQALGFIYVDTGALYRTVGLNALRRGVDLEKTEAIAESVKGISVELKYENGEQAVFLNGENVSAFIRTPEASMAASKVSAVPAVREFLFGLQQDIAAKTTASWTDAISVPLFCPTRRSRYSSPPPPRSVRAAAIKSS